MRYRLQLTGGAGRRLTLVGRKEIHDGPGPGLWRDTTTLPVWLFAGHLPPDAARLRVHRWPAGSSLCG